MTLTRRVLPFAFLIIPNVSQSITALLHSAGLALQTLTASKSTSADKREDFQNTSNEYLKTLQSVDVRLRRQVYGLEEAGIIPAEKAKPKSKEGPELVGGMSMGGKDKEEVSVGEGGMGKLDIGWLNSRSGRVGRDMEAELWDRARGFLEGIEGANGKQNGHAGKANTDEDYDMAS